jgi:hypothetical protein
VGNAVAPPDASCGRFLLSRVVLAMGVYMDAFQVRPMSRVTRRGLAATSASARKGSRSHPTSAAYRACRCQHADAMLRATDAHEQDADRRIRRPGEAQLTFRSS